MQSHLPHEGNVVGGGTNVALACGGAITPVVVADREALLRHISMLAAANTRLAFDQQRAYLRSQQASFGGDEPASASGEAVHPEIFVLTSEIQRLNELLAACGATLQARES